MKSFNERCYEILRKVPTGKVTSYRAIARVLNTKAYRAIGNAMNKNPYSPRVACHRVVKSSGEVGGFASGTENKIKMLQSEGINVQEGKVDLEKYEYKF